MPSVFKNQRQSLTGWSNTRKYFHYAVGEVLLIVIGVLIAVFLSNYNERLNRKRELRDIIGVLREDFSKDTLVVNEILNHYRIREPLFGNLATGAYSREQIRLCGECKYLITGHRLFYPTTTGIKLLQEHLSEDSSKENLIFVQFMQSYSSLTNQLELMEGNIVEDVNRSLLQWRDQYPWFAEFLQDPNAEGYLDYQENAAEFKNKVAYHYVLVYNNYLPVLDTYVSTLREFLNSVKL